SKISHKNSFAPLYVCTLQNIREQVFLREAYRQSEKWLRSIYNNAANLIIAIDKKGHIVTCNTQIENYLGYKKEEIYDFPMEKIVHPDFHDKLQSMLKEIFITGYSYDDELPMIRMDGSEIIVRMHSSALKNEEGDYIHTISIISDITEQKKREQMILELNSLVNAIRNIDQAITHESNITLLARKCCDILITLKGYVHVSIALLNRETGMIEPVAATGEHQSVSWNISLDGIGDGPYCLQEVIRTGKWRLSYPREEECRGCLKCKCRDSQNIVIFPILHNKQLYGVLARCMNDVPISLENDIDLIGEIADDLGFAYVKYEADLVVRQTKERYRRIIDNMSSGLAVYKAIDDGEDFIFVDFNRAGETIEAIKKEMVIGRRVTEVFPDVKDFGVYEGLQQVWRTGKPVYLPITLYQDERIQGWRENFIYKLETGEIIALYNDITEKKKAEERELLQQKQLIESNKLASLGTLVSGIAHEINNPNTFIMLNIAVLKEIFDSTDHIIREYMNIPGNELIDNLTYDELKKQIRQLTSGIAEGSERIKVIVKELRTYSGRDLDLEYKKFDINKSILSSTILVSGLLKKSTNNFTIDLQEIPDIMGNEKQIEQVVINLLQNACGALENPDRGISVESVYQAETDEVLVTISDEGKGIEQDKLEKIFDPFYTTKRDSGGVGLGLSICQKIIKNHHAAISFESEVNKGTKVILRFPVAHD
ncbi:MAG: PAS domain S-box protein, partial [Spirochaetales bacterium]|nr:PAS domain S-box protein [Spirochaetales bacterium]